MNKIENHPVMPYPVYADVQALAAMQGVGESEALGRLLEVRERAVQREKHDPLAHGWEAPIWLVADSLIDWPYVSDKWEREIGERTGLDWDRFKAAMRKAHGFDSVVTSLLILGGNRTSKSQYAAKRGCEMLVRNDAARVTWCHMSEQRSVDEQQPLIYQHLPPAWRVQTAGETTYIKWKLKTGFSGQGFICPNRSHGKFKFYKQERETALEGMEENLMLPDELIPVDWFETMEYRMTTRNGTIVITFTPIRGYSATVQAFLDGAQVTRWRVADCLPVDGGEPDLASELGLSAAEYAELRACEREKRPLSVPACRPEDVIGWVEGGVDGVAPVPSGRRADGRTFEIVPRVARSANPGRGVVWFHVSDSPYGNPAAVALRAVNQGRAAVKVRIYGHVERSQNAVFVEYDEGVHVIEDADIPEKGTNYLMMDPAMDRNFYLTWVRARPHEHIAYREWPSGYDIPGEGTPGPWAVPSPRKDGRNDGDRGEGTDSFGWGLWRYKLEIARLELWEDCVKWVIDHGGVWEEERKLLVFPTDRNRTIFPTAQEVIDEWDEDNGAHERINLRLIDPRAAESPRVDKGRAQTLLEDLADIGLGFVPAQTGSLIDSGVQKIKDRLSFERSVRDDDAWLKRPSLFIAKSMVNTRFAFRVWRNMDGNKSATKDPIDNLRYYFESDLEYEPGIGEAVPVRKGRRW